MNAGLAKHCKLSAGGQSIRISAKIIGNVVETDFDEGENTQIAVFKIEIIL